MITDEELNAMEARANVATAGPWEVEVGRVRAGDTPRVFGVETAYDDPEGVPEFPTRIRIIETDSGHYPPRRDDAEFIAHARTDVPKLTEEVRRLRAENEQWQNQVTFLRSRVGVNQRFPTR